MMVAMFIGLYFSMRYSEILIGIYEGCYGPD